MIDSEHTSREKQPHINGKFAKTHGMRKHPLYMRLMNMIQRCHNPKASGYVYYGEKGISVCYTWRNDPSSFIRWANANGWEPGLTIDRINNDGDYEPDNCRFITASENYSRTPVRSSLSMTDVSEIRNRAIRGEKHRVIAEDYGVTRQCVSKIVAWKSRVDR
jgi:hypothetical protein